VRLLIKKGAEANLYLEDWYGQKVIIKWRLPKAYRIPDLDKVIRTQRTLHEPQLIHKAKEAGVPTPTIFMINLAESKLILENVEGKQVKRVLNDLSPSGRPSLCRHIGVLIGRLHQAGIIHGDLTTSNMILTPSGKVFFVDFGLGEFSTGLEIRGVDLHLMKRALQSTHYKYAKECFQAIIEGYAQSVGKESTLEVMKKISEIEKRGRYIAERKDEGDAEAS
jgi:TP53 regulating kinase-like protein